MAAELETGWSLDTKSRRDKCSSETAKPKILIENPLCPLFLNSNIGKSNQLESTDSTVITTQYHLIIAVRECFEQMHRGNHVISEHPSNASSWSEMCFRKPAVRSNEAGINVFFARSLTAVGVPWQEVKEAKAGGKDETASPKGESKADSIGDTMLSVDNVGKNQDCCELGKTMIGKESDGSHCGTENEAEASIEAIKALPRRSRLRMRRGMRELVPPTFFPMKMDTFTSQQVTWRREADRQLGVLIDFDQKKNLIQVIDVSEIGLAGEKNR